MNSYDPNGSIPIVQLTATGREHSMATGCLQEAKFHWPLSGNEFEEWTVSSRPFSDIQRSELIAAKQPLTLDIARTVQGRPTRARHQCSQPPHVYSSSVITRRVVRSRQSVQILVLQRPHMLVLTVRVHDSRQAP